MKTTLKLQNVKCSGCTNVIAVRLLKLSDINGVKISDGSYEISFTYETVNNLVLAERTLTQMGYPPEDAENTTLNKAKSFISCATGRLNINI
ncbi:MAG: heavy metal transporter [Patiriisocius sp.]|uniref:heavy metal transporter n=1 Tax=Patiriisocius sp. TaxID=2822396 RepID=UPI003EF097D6